jgi:tetratricopeptide (TPR) repeat protein
MAEAHSTMSAVHEARGATLRQREELGEALRLAPGLLPVRLNLARLLIASKAPAAALDILDAKETYPSQKQTVPYIVQRNWALLALGRREELRKGIDQGLAASRTPDLLVQNALLQSQEKNYVGAKSSLNEALNQNPEYLPALEALMRLYAAQKKVPEAIENIRVYVAKRPNSALLQEILGNLLAATGKPGEARSAYMQAQAADPRGANPILALANLDLSEGKFDSARERMDKVQTLDPKNPQVWLRRGLLEVNRKNSPAAIDSFRKVLEVDPKNVLALNNLAYLLATQPNQANDALQYAQQAKELSPDLPDIDDTLGWVLYNKAVYQSALSYLENALKKHNDSAIRYHLAMTYTKLGDKRGPQMLRETLKAAPDLPEAAMAQRMLAETPRNSK